MARDTEHNPDPNLTASRIVAELAAGSDALPADVETAWQAWSKQIQRVDERGMSLLKAAFEAGYDASRRAAPKQG